MPWFIFEVMQRIMTGEFTKSIYRKYFKWKGQYLNHHLMVIRLLNSDYPILRYHSGGKKKVRTLGTIKTVCLTSKKRKRMNTEEMITEVEMDL